MPDEKEKGKDLNRYRDRRFGGAMTDPECLTRGDLEFRIESGASYWLYDRMSRDKEEER